MFINWHQQTKSCTSIFLLLFIVFNRGTALCGWGQKWRGHVRHNSLGYGIIVLKYIVRKKNNVKVSSAFSTEYFNKLFLYPKLVSTTNYNCNSLHRITQPEHRKSEHLESSCISLKCSPTSQRWWWTLLKPASSVYFHFCGVIHLKKFIMFCEIRQILFADNNSLVMWLFYQSVIYWNPLGCSNDILIKKHNKE